MPASGTEIVFIVKGMTTPVNKLFFIDIRYNESD